MMLGVPRDLRLTSARETFLLDCKAAGLSKKAMRGYRDVLTSFIRSVGDMRVRELGPEHVRLYIADLSDRKPHRNSRSLLTWHYNVVRTWVRWMYAQKTITKRVMGPDEPPRRSAGRLLFLLGVRDIFHLYPRLPASKEH